MTLFVKMKCFYRLKGWDWFIGVFKRSILCLRTLHLFNHKYCEIWLFSFLFSHIMWSFRNHSNMLICSTINISYYYQCWSLFTASYFCGNHETFISEFFDKSKVQKSSIYYKCTSFVTMQKSLLPLLINVVQTFKCLKKKMMKVANYPKYVSVWRLALISV